MKDLPNSKAFGPNLHKKKTEETFPKNNCAEIMYPVLLFPKLLENSKNTASPQTRKIQNRIDQLSTH